MMVDLIVKALREEADWLTMDSDTIDAKIANALSRIADVVEADAKRQRDEFYAKAASPTARIVTDRGGYAE